MPVSKMSVRAKARKKKINRDSSSEHTAWRNERDWEMNKKRRAVAARHRIEKRRKARQHQVERETRAVKGLFA